MAKKVNHCPECEGDIDLVAGQGGRGTRDLTTYFARCSCGYSTDPIFSDDGTKRDAVRQWNGIPKVDALRLRAK